MAPCQVMTSSLQKEWDTESKQRLQFHPPQMAKSILWHRLHLRQLPQGLIENEFPWQLSLRKGVTAAGFKARESDFPLSSRLKHSCAQAWQNIQEKVQHGAGEMPWRSRALAALQEDPSSVASTHNRQFRTVCDSRSRGSDTLSWLAWALYWHAHNPHTNTYTHN